MRLTRGMSILLLSALLPACASGGATILTAAASSPGGDFEGMETGYGLALSRSGEDRPFQMGWGLGLSRHAGDAGMQSWFFDGFLEPRIVVGQRLQTVVPFAGVRLGSSFLTTTEPESDAGTDPIFGEAEVGPWLDVGLLYGGNAGAMIFLNRSLAMEASLGYYQQSIVSEGEGLFDSGASGSRVQLGLGLRWGR